MKVSKDAARSARQLLRLSYKEGLLDNDRIKEITTKVSEAKPRDFLAILQEYGRLVRLDVEQRQAIVETAVEIGAHARVVGRKDLDGDSVNGNVTDTDQYPIVEVYLSGHRSNFVKAQVSTSV